jgi:hypothetical protein
MIRNKNKRSDNFYYFINKNIKIKQKYNKLMDYINIEQKQRFLKLKFNIY